MTVVETDSGASAGAPWTTRMSARLGPRRFSLLVFAGCFGVLFAWWLAFFPVLVTPDSFTYVYEATTNHWMTDHSVVYDALIWLSLQSTHGVATLTFLQIVAFAAVIAYIANGLRLIGTPPVATGIVPVVALLAPSLGAFPVYLWKDVPFTLTALWLLGLLIRLVPVAETGPDWSSSPPARRLVRWIFVATLLMCLFRNNAFVFAFLAAVVLFILWRRASLRLVGAMVAAIVAAIVLTAFVFPALGVQRAKSDLLLGTAYDDIAYIYQHDPHALSAADQSLLRQVAPLSHWRKSGGCYTSDDLTNSPDFSRDAASANSGKLFALWRRLSVDHPVALFRVRMCRGFIAWSPVPGPKGIGGTVFPLTHEPERRFQEIPNPTFRNALRPAPVTGDRDFAQSYLHNSFNAEWALWRGATWAYVLYLAIAVAVWRTRRWSLVALAALPLGVQIGVILDNPNQLVRYMMLPLYAGVILLPLVALRRRAPAAELQATDEPPPTQPTADEPVTE